MSPLTARSAGEKSTQRRGCRRRPVHRGRERLVAGRPDLVPVQPGRASPVARRRARSQGQPAGCGATSRYRSAGLVPRTRGLSPKYCCEVNDRAWEAASARSTDPAPSKRWGGMPGELTIPVNGLMLPVQRVRPCASRLPGGTPRNLGDRPIWRVRTIVGRPPAGSRGDRVLTRATAQKNSATSLKQIDLSEPDSTLSTRCSQRIPRGPRRPRLVAELQYSRSGGTHHVRNQRVSDIEHPAGATAARFFLAWRTLRGVHFRDARKPDYRTTKPADTPGGEGEHEAWHVERGGAV
jgi:hypothetical protein